MAHQTEIVKYLDNLFRPESYDDVVLNGLVVEGRNSVKKIGFCVDASLNFFEMAKENSCRFLIVHHGYLKNKPLSGVHKNRMKYLLDNDMSLYVLHFPMDVDDKINHNHELAKHFKATPISGLMQTRDHSFGIIAELKNEVKREDFMLEVEEKLDTPCHLLAFGKKKIKKIAFSCGSCTSDLTGLPTEEFDLLLTGESRHSNHHDAEELKINVLYAGHYATEKPGLWRLQQEIEKKFKDVKTIFFDIPTSV